MPVPPTSATAAAAERERYRRWWIEESGLTVRELHEIAFGLSVAPPEGFAG